MTKAPYRRGLLMAFAAIAGSAAMIWLLTSKQWFSFYGLASVLLAAVPPLGWLLWQRLPVIDWHRAWAFLFIGPALILGLIQIGFWMAYFSVGVNNPTLGIVREMVLINAGPLIPLAAGALLAVWVWLFARTSSELP